MFTGTMIDQLIATVAKVEEHAYTEAGEALETAYYALSDDYTTPSTLVGVA